MGNTAPHRAKENGFRSSDAAEEKEEPTRVFACSDLHVDHKSNWELLQQEVSAGGYTGRDVLIVAGDVSTELALLRRTLAFLTTIFHGGEADDLSDDNDDDDDERESRSDEGPSKEEEEENEEAKRSGRRKRRRMCESSRMRSRRRMSNVFFCPGNNELRLARSDKREGIKTSLEKLVQVLRVCEELGVHTRPAQVNGEVWIVPLMAWYTPQFDPKWSGDDHDYRRRWLDFRACVWPQEMEEVVGGVSAHFLAINEQHIQELPFPLNRPVVSFSHFLPRFELLPMRMLLHNQTLPLVVGDERLDEQIRRIDSRVHVFAHTHINKDASIDGVRYVQNALGHPAERSKPWHLMKSRYRPKLVYTSCENSVV